MTHHPFADYHIDLLHRQLNILNFAPDDSVSSAYIAKKAYVMTSPNPFLLIISLVLPANPDASIA